MARVEIGKNTQLVPGDIIELEFGTFDIQWFQNLQMALLEKQITEKHPEYYLIGTSLSADGKTITLTIKIREMPPQIAEAGVSPALIITGIIVIAGGLFIWLTAGKVYKITEEITKSPALAIGAMLIPVAVVLYLLLRFKRRK